MLAGGCKGVWYSGKEERKPRITSLLSLPPGFSFTHSTEIRHCLGDNVQVLSHALEFCAPAYWMSTGTWLNQAGHQASSEVRLGEVSSLTYDLQLSSKDVVVLGPNHV